MKRKLKNIFTIMTMTVVLGLTGCSKDNKKIEPAKNSDSMTVADATTASDTIDTENDITEANTTENKDNTITESIAEEDALSDTYAEVIGQIYELIQNGNIAEYDNDRISVPLGIYENISYQESPEDTLNSVGYNLIDIDGDGQDELIIGIIGHTADDTDALDKIFGIYTIVDGKVSLVLDGWYRNTFYLMDDNKLFNQGSGGALMFSFGSYRLVNHAINLETVDTYYSDTLDGENAIYYHRISDTESEELSEDDFYAANDEFKSHVVDIDYIPFATWEE